MGSLMTNPPRMLLNRILLSAIILMTLAIFALGAAIIWKLFLAGEPESALSEQRQRFDTPTATIEYILPEGCKDQVTIKDEGIEIRFVGETCASRRILEANGNLILMAE